MRRYREEREGSIEIRLEEGDLEVYYVKEEGTNGEEKLLEGTMKGQGRGIGVIGFDFPETLFI